MCGILGASFAQGVIDPRRFADALDLLSHRGPDQSSSKKYDHRKSGERVRV